jgi:hypothetical protein
MNQEAQASASTIKNRKKNFVQNFQKNPLYVDKVAKCKDLRLPIYQSPVLPPPPLQVPSTPEAFVCVLLKAFFLRRSLTSFSQLRLSPVLTPSLLTLSMYACYTSFRNEALSANERLCAGYVSILFYFPRRGYDGVFACQWLVICCGEDR